MVHVVYLGAVSNGGSWLENAQSLGSRNSGACNNPRDSRGRSTRWIYTVCVLELTSLSVFVSSSKLLCSYFHICTILFTLKYFGPLSVPNKGGVNRVLWLWSQWLSRWNLNLALWSAPSWLFATRKREWPYFTKEEWRGDALIATCQSRRLETRCLNGNKSNRNRGVAPWWSGRENAALTRLRALLLCCSIWHDDIKSSHFSDSSPVFHPN